MELLDFNLDQLIKYAGIGWGIIASALLTSQQIILLKQKNEFGQFCIDILNRCNEIERELDKRLDQHEERLLLKLKDISARCDIHENKLESHSGWISKLYNYILFEETNLPIIKENGKEEI